jgi:hypothetical protein
MGGVPVRIEKVVPPAEASPEEQTPEAETTTLLPAQENRKQARILAMGKKPRPSEEDTSLQPAG